jgi:hypothetical protein
LKKNKNTATLLQKALDGVKAKAAHRKIQFPIDCQKSFELGVSLLK